MASIVGSIDAMEQEKVVENAKSIGEDHLGPALHELAERHPIIGEVRGLGVFWALDLVDDRDSRTPVSSGLIGDLKKQLMQRHLVPFTADNRLHVVPPAIITPDDVARGVAIIDEALTEVEANR
jgi:taurine--2-oxoglutarate transaminase